MYDLDKRVGASLFAIIRIFTSTTLPSYADLFDVIAEPLYDHNRLTQTQILKTSGVVLQSYTYTLDVTGRRTAIAEATGRTTNYSYDNLYRLTAESISDVVPYSASYTYDAVSNRVYETVNGVSTAYSYDDNDRLLTQGGVSYTYDAQGNTLSQDDDGTLTTYRYDGKNKLSSVSSGGETTRYRYNHNGTRMGKVLDVDGSGGVSTAVDFVVDENRDYSQVLVELNGGGSTEVSYTYGDDLLSQNRAGVSSTYHYDGLGSTRALSDVSGNLTDSYEYDAFGVELSSTGTSENDYRYTGEQFDEELDQYHLRARQYAPSSGRFMSMDTWAGWESQPISLNKYLYANADPAINVDPSGNISLGHVSAAYTVRAVLGNAAVGGAFGGVDAYLGGDSVAGGALSGAVTGGLLGPLAKVAELRKPLITTFTALGFIGAGSSVSSGNYGQAAFRGVASALGAYVFLKTSIIPSNVKAPSIVDGLAYSGVYNSRTGQIVLRNSVVEGSIPAGSVPARGGHGIIAREEFSNVNPSELFGFTVLSKKNGVIVIEFKSRSVNGQANPFVPKALRPDIARVVGAATGKTPAFNVD